jgi:hypothetical protein
MYGKIIRREVNSIRDVIEESDCFYKGDLVNY